MAVSSRAQTEQKFQEFFGIDRRTSALINRPGYAYDMENCVYTKSNEIEKRKGEKAIAVGSGPYGCCSYSHFSETTGSITTEILSVGNTLYKLNPATITVSYTGANQCLLDIYFSPGSSAWFFRITEGSTTKLDYNLGIGFDEASSVTLANVQTQVNAISGGLFTASISGTSTTPAALLAKTDSLGFNVSTPATATAYYWSAVNTPVAAMMQWYEDNKNSDEFVNCVPVQKGFSMYFPNPTSGYGMMKYDGQTFYRAGLPQLLNPTLAEVSGLGGVAEVTTITTRQAAATAEVETVATIADTSTAEVSQVIFLASGLTAYDGYYIIIYDQAGSVCLWWGSSQPSAGTNRYIHMTDHGGHNPNGWAESFKLDVDADAQFIAVRSGSTVTITDAVNGARTDISQGTMPVDRLTVSTTTQGVAGLQQKYFMIYDENGSVAVWANVGGSATAPSVGANRYISYTISAGASANTVASAIQSAVDADSKFSATVITNTVTITDTSTVLGSRTDATSGDSGFTVTTTVQGVDSINNKYFIMYDNSNASVAFWYNVSGTGVEPAHGASRAVAITTVTGSMTANQVATETELAIEADQWSSTVLTNVVTATADTTGSKNDATAGTSGFTLNVTTQGSTSGIGAATFKYRISPVMVDDNGVEYEGNLSPDIQSITLSSSSKDTRLTITGIQANSGYMTDCAKVNGNQTGVNTITVSTGHTMKSGDKAYFYDRKTPSGYTTRNVTATTSTSVTVDGATVNVNSLDIISAGLKIAIYRSKAGGSDLFLVAEVPNNSLDGTFTYQDSSQDSALTAQLSVPFTDRSPPGSFKYLTVVNGVGAGTGFLTDPDQTNFSDTESIEYWPADTNEFLADTIQGDRASGISENDQVLLIGKEGPNHKSGSIHVVSGNLDENGNFQRNVRTNGIGFFHSSVVSLLEGTKLFTTPKGIYAMSSGNAPDEASFFIEPLLTSPAISSSQTQAMHRTTVINDNDNERVIFFVPIEQTTGAKYATSQSYCFIYDYSKDINGNPSHRWYKWTGINAAGGFIKVGEDIYHIERRFSTYTGLVSSNLYKFHTGSDSLSYEDHKTYIPWLYQLRFEDFGDADSYKDFTSIVTHSEEVLPSSFTLTVSVEADYQNNVITTDTLTVGGQFNDELITKIKEGKARKIRIKYTNSQDQTNVRLSGITIQAVKTYNDAIVR